MKFGRCWRYLKIDVLKISWVAVLHKLIMRFFQRVSCNCLCFLSHFIFYFWAFIWAFFKKIKYIVHFYAFVLVWNCNKVLFLFLNSIYIQIYTYFFPFRRFVSLFWVFKIHIFFAILGYFLLSSLLLSLSELLIPKG